MHLTQLNRECLVHVFSFLDKDSRRDLAQACSALRGVFEEPTLWPRLNFSSPGELTQKNYVLGPALKSLSICWYSSRVKICNVEAWMKTPLQRSMCEGHQDTVSDFLQRVGDRCPNLKSLTLSGCAHVTDASLTRILQRCPQLRALKLENCSGVTDKTLAAIPAHVARLETLHVNFCRNVTQGGIRRAQEACPGLAVQAERSAEMIADRLPEEKVRLQPTLRKLLRC
ncbi:F-box and leucine-rich protein 22 [Ascaphus truei]|uniref:F-box and leucine-rich protein 22 n=1 Tax=Ascaphus truei TaxID=8439 RepID=UPI003F59970B